MIDWEVYLSGGEVMTSKNHRWEDIPGGILIVRWWDKEKRQKGIHWGDSYYGHPDTWKSCGEIADEEFQNLLADVNRKPWPSDYTSSHQ